MRKFAARLLRLLPESVGRLALPASQSYRPEDVPPPPVAPPTTVRLYIAPVNWAGQAFRWGRAAERFLPSVGAVTTAYRVGTEFGHPVDLSVPVGAYVVSKRWQKAQRDAVVAGFSHVLVEAARNPFGRIDEPLERQVADLRRHGVQVALLFHGSDIRLPSAHAAREHDSPFASGLWRGTAALQREAEEHLALTRRLGLEVFVSTLDLLEDVPDATWLPLVVDTARWGARKPPLKRAIPVVLHVPSKSVMKGSELVEPTMRRLESEGLLEYRVLAGVAAQDMPAEIAKSDIVLDQVRLGSYGVAACEALAAGRVVVGHVSDQVRKFTLERTGRSLPIVEATARTLESVVRDLVADRAAARVIGAKGPEFVREVHDGRLAAEALAPFLSPVDR